MSIRTLVCTGEAVSPYVDDLARLRIAVFREYPYLYEGDRHYESEYLVSYARSPGSVFVLALDGEQVVGVSTGMPLADEAASIQQPFVDRGLPLHEVFYFGESVLLPNYRGQGLGHAFMDGREAHARALGGFLWTAFCAVERADDDPRKPAGYRPNDVFWRKRGYQRQDDMFCVLNWKETGDSERTPHHLRFWLRPVDAAA